MELVTLPIIIAIETVAAFFALSVLSIVISALGTSVDMFPIMSAIEFVINNPIPRAILSLMLGIAGSIPTTIVINN